MKKRFLQLNIIMYYIKEIYDPILGYTDLMGWSPQALGLSIMETHLSS